MKRHARDAILVAGGTALTATGTLVGVRLLTQLLSPAVYGTVTLALGLSTLALGLAATPLTQAAMHLYPWARANGSDGELERSLLRLLARLAPWVALTAVAAILVSSYRRVEDPTAVAAAAVLICLDSLRSANLSLLNSARRHHRYTTWTVVDTWGRPLAASGAALLLSASAKVVLCTYVAVAALLLVVFSDRRRRQRESPAASLQSRSGPSPSATEPGAADAERRALDRRMWSYALPLVPLGIISWASNLGDRYIIGGTLGLADAGIYAAVYGLSSAPFMVAGGTVELMLRPVHQAAVAAGDNARANSILRLWILAVVTVCSAGVMAFAFGHHLVATLFLGRAYRDWSVLMPWIGLGYAIRSTSYVFERVCYAYGHSRRVLAIQLFAAVATIVATPIGVLGWGLRGGAGAVSVYFGVQLAAALFFARRTLREVTEQDCRGCQQTVT